jgi:hypothetical protein
MGLSLLAGCVATAQGESYRGDYTYGHEVNVFCPTINSRCYWLGPNSSQAARVKLKQIYEDGKPGLYKPVCVVVEGVIDRDTPRDGFAADYDGLIDIETVHGNCDDSALITPGDLNHRRWVLVEHDGIAVDAKLYPVVLDFGERLFVEITEGCRRFSGFAELDADRIRFDRLESDLSACNGDGPPTSIFPGKISWQLVRKGRNRLELSTTDTRLAFSRDDWR